MPRILSRLVSVLLLLSLTGCIAVAAGAAAGYGTAQYLKNSDTRNYSAGSAATWKATVDTLTCEGYCVSPCACITDQGGRIESGDATVVVEALTENATRVQVRIGTFSTAEHRQRAARILDGIAARLNTP